MNWIIIAADKFEDEVKELETFFLEKNYKPSTFFVTDYTVTSIDSFYVDLHKTTHCIFISDGTVPMNPHLFYATGFLNGLNRLAVANSGRNEP